MLQATRAFRAFRSAPPSHRWSGFAGALREDREGALLGLVLGLLVTAPLIGGGRTLLLDWVHGPHSPVLGPGFLGLEGGLTTGALDGIGLSALGHVVGPALTWLVLLSVFVVASAGAGHLVGGPRWARLPAGALYAVNPWVYNRIYAGHLALLMGYALLPFAAGAALRASRRRGLAALSPALWWAVLTALSPHYAWIYGVVVLVAFAAGGPRDLLRAARFFGAFAAFALMSAYIVLPHGATQPLVQAGATSLAIYRTTGDSHYGLFVNVAGLYGFWRTGPGPALPKQAVAGWPLMLLAVLVVAGVGAVGVLRRPAPGNREDVVGALQGLAPRHREGRDRRQQALVLLVAGVAGYFLALGDQGPTGPLFRWAYFNVPFFQVMREPEKFLMLTALAYSVFFGWGVERLARGLTETKRAAAAVGALGLALPLVYCPTIFWGLAGQVAPSRVPTSYQRLGALMGKGAGRVLYVPWHLYLAYPFTGKRVVGNIGPSFFGRDVISGDNLQVGTVQTQSTSPRSAYIERLLARGKSVDDFGALVAPLGAQYVVLAKTVNWKSYTWLAHQADLRLVYDGPSLEAWANLAYGGVGQRVARPVGLSGLTSLVAASGAGTRGGLDAGAVVFDPPPPAHGTVAHGAPADRSPAPLGQDAAAPARGGLVREVSPVAYQVPPGRPGWVTVDTTYQEGWYLEGEPARKTAEGTMMFPAGAAGGMVRFRPWGVAKLGYGISAGVFVLLGAAVARGLRRERAPGVHRGPVAR